MEIVNERFGSHVHILNWALHLDESTPHIHERHVFDCENQYGEIAPQQEKALEALGFELPEQEKPVGRKNNRKMTFDSACRVLCLMWRKSMAYNWKKNRNMVVVLIWKNRTIFFSSKRSNWQHRSKSWKNSR